MDFTSDFPHDILSNPLLAPREVCVGQVAHGSWACHGLGTLNGNLEYRPPTSNQQLPVQDIFDGAVQIYTFSAGRSNFVTILLAHVV